MNLVLALLVLILIIVAIKAIASSVTRSSRVSVEVLRRQRDEVVERILASRSAEFDRHFHTKTAGVTHKNADGTDRQSILQRCIAMEELVLIREPWNPYDKEAVAVRRLNGDQIGYLRREVASEIAGEMDAGWEWGAILTEVTGGWESHENRGANLLLVRKAKTEIPRQPTTTR